MITAVWQFVGRVEWPPCIYARAGTVLTKSGLAVASATSTVARRVAAFHTRLHLNLDLRPRFTFGGKGCICVPGVLWVEICHHSAGPSCARVETGRDDLNLSKFTKRLLELPKRDVPWYVLDENLHEIANLNNQGNRQCHCLGRTYMMVGVLLSHDGAAGRLTLSSFPERSTFGGCIGGHIGLPPLMLSSSISILQAAAC